MNHPWLYEFPMWESAALFVAVLFLALEGGYRAGLRRYRIRGKSDKIDRGDVTLASMFAVLGLVLAALMLIITDFDRSLNGMIQVSHHSLDSVIQDMEKALAR